MDDRQRNPAKWGRQVHEYETLASFESVDVVPSGVVVVWVGDSPVEVLYEPTGSETVVVTFHAALTRDGVELPLFVGGNLLAGTTASRILVSDSGLYSDQSLRIGWFAGTSSLRLQDALLRVLARLTRASGASRSIYFGASAGGFAALYYGRGEPQCLVIAVNPQTIIRNFTEASWLKYAHHAFDARSPEGVTSVFEERICSDLRKRYQEELPNGNVLYVQNSTDHHVGLHLDPFLESKPRAEIRVLMGDWGQGHVAPPAPALKSLLHRTIDHGGTWPSLLDEVDPSWVA